MELREALFLFVGGAFTTLIAGCAGAWMIFRATHIDGTEICCRGQRVCGTSGRTNPEGEITQFDEFEQPDARRQPPPAWNAGEENYPDPFAEEKSSPITLGRNAAFLAQINSREREDAA
jgi:hypothetical protein